MFSKMYRYFAKEKDEPSDHQIVLIGYPTESNVFVMNSDVRLKNFPLTLYDANDGMVTWSYIAGEYLIKGTICLGYSRDGGKTFIFAPEPETMMNDGDIIKVIHNKG